MSISVSCPGCASAFRVPDSKQGRKIKCPVCSETFVASEADEEIEIEQPLRSPSRHRRGRQSKRNSNPLAVPIGIAVALVVMLVVGWAVSRLKTSTIPAPIEQTPSVATTSVSPFVDPNTTVANVTRPVETPVAPKVTKPAEPEETGPVKPDVIKEMDDFFDKGVIPELRIQIAEPEMEILNKCARSFVIGDQRPSVEADLIENGTTKYKYVTVKLKGSAGSYRPIDDRPALSINIAKNEKDQAFHGMKKFHLNNSVQDPTYLHEWVCEQLFHAAKLPATRVTHARVWLNDRDLGFYVLKSAFDRPLLERNFGNSKGNLYEGGFLQDIDAELERDSGKGVDDRSDLTSLLSACRETEASVRWDRISEVLDVDQFVSFMAMELMVWHWDGYTNSHNNYRLYFDSRQKKAHFIPHGMDQVFGDPGASVINFPPSIVSSAVMMNGEWRSLFRDRIGEFLALFSPPDELLKRIDEVNSRIRPVLAKISPQQASEHDDRVTDLKNRIRARIENLILQHKQPDPTPREFDDKGRLVLANWYPVSESPDAKLDVVDVPKGIRAFSILCGKKSRCNASWRCKELLGKGTYVLHAKLKSNQIAASDERNIAVGAGIRIDGTTRTNVRKGTTNWVPIEFEFNVEEEIRTVEFVAELRARNGQVWYEVDSLFLTRKSVE